MNPLPDAKTYELEMKYMPWGILIERVVSKVFHSIPLNGRVLDLMCGPGFLLESIRVKRPDLELVGVDCDSRFIRHGKEQKSGIKYIKANVLSWQDSSKFDCVICTGGVHHLPFNDQPKLFAKMATLLEDDGLCICGDPCVAEYSNERERRLAAAELGYMYLKEVISGDAPSSIIKATTDILHNDVLMDGEFKNSRVRLIKMVAKVFGEIDMKKTWPRMQSNFGDYLLILKK